MSDKDKKNHKSLMTIIGDKKNRRSRIAIMGSGVLFVIIAIPLIISFVSPEIHSEITADGILGYIIEWVTVISTIVLSGVAVWQTRASNTMAEQANEVSQKLLNLENNRYKLEIRPFFMIVDWKAGYKDYEELYEKPKAVNIQVEYYDGGIALALTFKLKNTTQSYITIEYSDAHSDDNTIQWGNCIANQPNSVIYLAEGADDDITFYADEKILRKCENKRMILEFILQNRFAERYIEQIVISIEWLTDEFPHEEGEFCFSVKPQKYKIGRFSDSHNIEWEDV